MNFWFLFTIVMVTLMQPFANVAKALPQGIPGFPEMPGLPSFPKMPDWQKMPAWRKMPFMLEMPDMP
ncbi:pre-mRNA polyadenylation factor FIP1-like [Chrysoperla carnea]|uniref:pre-mRNA polyadenylation factor FIP1-like n=1 Tax=Chrysoperla carnea TaxID=189513 RepID=UPI001D05FA70|nr:pre-mRNA polyadenylation factor FIP1-like [Chrysoperla carnea]